MTAPPFIGVLSDTHGYCDPVLDDLFSGAERIIHAGDIGVGVLEKLRRIAPVTAVLGNTDPASLLPDLPAEATTEVLGMTLLVAHIRRNVEHAHDPAAEHVDLVVTGHSHRAAIEWRGETLYLNPGAAGHARFGLPRTAALVIAEGGRPRARIVTLD